MRSDSRSGMAGKSIRLYLLAGFNTSPDFMEGARLALTARLEEAGCRVSSRLLFPYGDWSRSSLAQLREIRRDLSLAPERIGRSIGGRRTLAAIEAAEREDGETETGGTAADEEAERKDGEAKGWTTAGEMEARCTVLIGHSGGGVAAIHAAKLLLEQRGAVPGPIVMIGSPKCRIPPELREAVLYIYKRGKREPTGTRLRSPDPVPGFGSFGGWGRGDRGLLPVWQPRKHGPAALLAMPTVGGHADYFRQRHPYVDAEGRTNLERMLDAVWAWLARHGAVQHAP